MDLFGTCSCEKEFNTKTTEYINNFQHKDIVIWGVGESLDLFIKTVKHRLNIKYIVDKNWENFAQNKGGGVYLR